MIAGLIGFGGPLLIISVFLVIFWQRLGKLQKFAFFVIVYAISVLTGILSDVVGNVGNEPSAIIAGIVAPLAYCLIFSWVINSRSTKKGIVVPKQDGIPEGTNQWNPMIVAAIIQAVASIIVALIAILGK